MDNTRRILWRMIAGIGIFLLVFPMISVALTDQTLPVPAPTPITFEQTMSKNAFSYGEIIPVTTEIHNFGENPIDLSGVPPEIIVSTRKTGWDRGIIRTIPPGRDTFTLEPHSNQTWVVPWDQKDEQGQQVEPGVYYLTMNASGRNSYGEVIILYPEGALTGSISSPDNVTSNGITMQLNTLTLDENEGIVNVGIYLPDGSGTPDSGSGFTQITAEYQIDDGPVMNFRDISVLELEPGVSKIFWQTAPVPCYAKTLDIHVTKFDPYEGDWNLSINLDSFSRCTSGEGSTFPRPNASPTTATPLHYSIPVAAVGIIGVYARIFRR